MPSPIQNYIEQRKEEFKKEFYHLTVRKDGTDYIEFSTIAVPIEHVESFHTETITTVLRMVREVVEKDDDIRTSRAQGEYERGFDYGYDIKKRHILEFLPDIT